MSCGIIYNPNEPFSKQCIGAWGKFQIEGVGDPYYKENDLNASNFVFFSRYKNALDDAYNEFKSMFEPENDEYTVQRLCKAYKKRLSQRICDTLYFLIDDQHSGY